MVVCGGACACAYEFRCCWCVWSVSLRVGHTGPCRLRVRMPQTVCVVVVVCVCVYVCVYVCGGVGWRDMCVVC